MSKIKIYWLIGIILIISLSGCITQQKCWEKFPPIIKDSISYVEKVKDTTIFITDSAGIIAALECDSLGRVRIRQIQEMYAGQFVKPTVVIKDNWLKIACKIDSGAVYFSWKETHIRQVKVQTFVKITNVLNGWQNFRVWLGTILLIIVGLYVGFRILIKVIPGSGIGQVLSKFL